MECKYDRDISRIVRKDIRIVPEWNVNPIASNLSPWPIAYKNSTRMECKSWWNQGENRSILIRIVPEWNVNPNPTSIFGTV